MYFKYKDYLKSSKEYQAMLVEMQEDVIDFFSSFKDDPRLISGWGHGYFCNEDGGRLIYDRSQPLAHKCSICGKVYTDFMFQSYFVTMYRNEAVVTALKSALLYNIYEDIKYLDITKKIIGFYAENYKYFALHAKDKINADLTIDVGGAGKIMPQGLNEAIIAIRFINALNLVKEYLDDTYLKRLKEDLFKPIVELLLPQKMHIHNISVWINSAIGMIGLFFDEEEWVKEATSNPFNLYEQIKAGVTESGFWYEGSIHYNFFALEGAMSYLVFAKMYQLQIPREIEETVFHMLEAAYDYAFDNDRFPNPSDGWPNISLQTYSYVYYMGYEALGERVLPYIKHIESTPMVRGKLPLSEPYYYKNKIPMERIQFAPAISELTCNPVEKRYSYNFEGSNCAILRNNTFNVFLKYGHQTTSHAHPDKMNVEIMVNDQVLTKDLSNAGYASKLCNGWHRKIAAHNTCAINGEPTDISRQGEILQFNDHLVEARAIAYENVTYTRKIEITETTLNDTFKVEGQEEGVIDWFFHLETPVSKELLTLETIDLFKEYEYIQNVNAIKTDNKQIILKNNLVEIMIELEEGMTVFLAETYNNPANKMRDTIIIRKHAKKALFKSSIKKINN